MTPMHSRLAGRAAARGARLSHDVSANVSRRRTFLLRTESPYASRRRQHFLRSVTFVVAAGCIATLYQWSQGGTIFPDAHAEAAPNPSLVEILSRNKKDNESQYKEAPPEKAEIVFEKTRRPANASKDETRDRISSQHLQVRKSWENPGVWCWGANDGHVAAPGAKESMVKSPRWMPNFEGKLLRDLKLSRRFGAAISEEGDLLQWGDAYFLDDDSPSSSSSSSSTSSKSDVQDTSPTVTLRGKNLVHLAITSTRIIALSASGRVYSLSVSRHDQLNGPKPPEQRTSLLPGWLLSTPSKISYRTLPTPDRVTSIAAGLDHALLLTASGHVYSAAASNFEYPSRGQLGIPGLTWFSRPADKPYDAPHEVTPLHGFRIAQIAAGDYHSVALDRQGRVFAWGDNARGQLGLGETRKDSAFYDTPSLLPITKLYQGTAQRPRVTGVHAGGNTTFLTVDAERVAQPTDADPTASGSAVAATFRGLGRITADVWACGHGIWGQLGNGRWTHVQALPTRIAPLSGLFEYSEAQRRAVPIRMRGISVGAAHCAATMDNVTYTGAGDGGSENDTNWGADVLWFGNNEFFQLGTGKRNNVVVPTYVQPMDRTAEVAEGKRGQVEEHRFHATPASSVKVGGRWVRFEQRVVCGRGVSAVYSGV